MTGRESKSTCRGTAPSVGDESEEYPRRPSRVHKHVLHLPPDKKNVSFRARARMPLAQPKIAGIRVRNPSASEKKASFQLPQ